MNEDTLLLMEEFVADTLVDMKFEKDLKAKEQLTDCTVKIVEKLNEARRIELDYAEKEAKRVSEDNRAKETAEMEAKTNKKRMAVEIAKVTIPVVISAAIGVFMQKRSFHFEENGSISSFTARESCHLPKIWK